MKHKLLLVDDDKNLLATTRQLLESEDYEVDIAASGAEAIERVGQNPHEYALVIVDYGLPDMTGAEVIAEALKINKDLYVLVLSGAESLSAVQAPWRAGAVAFVQKSEGAHMFLDAVRRWCKKYDETTRTLIKPSADQSVSARLIRSVNLIGQSAGLVAVAKKIQLYRSSTKPVLIIGETGTGKELVARSLHLGEDSSFYPVNCAAYRENTALMESELFGHVAGAFTGAAGTRKGIFQVAKTVFLDEIHHLSPTAQAKLLRVLQTKKIRPVGSNAEIPVNFRLISAAKPEILEMKRDGSFMPDLYRRIKVLHIEVPPLRERKDDIEPLISHFCRKFEEETGQKKTFLLSTVNFMRSYSWPENVGELENKVEELLTHCQGDKVLPQDLDLSFFEGEGTPLHYADVVVKQDNLEKETIRKVLETSASLRQAARRLGIPRTTFRRRLEELKITVPESLRRGGE